jgi:hypothetical protein
MTPRCPVERAARENGARSQRSRQVGPEPPRPLGQGKAVAVQRFEHALAREITQHAPKEVFVRAAEPRKLGCRLRAVRQVIGDPEIRDRGDADRHREPDRETAHFRIAGPTRHICLLHGPSPQN